MVSIVRSKTSSGAASRSSQSTTALVLAVIAVAVVTTAASSPTPTPVAVAAAPTAYNLSEYQVFYVSTVHRHGARTPLIWAAPFIAYNYSACCDAEGGQGALTPHGMAMLTQLGRFLAHTYGEDVIPSSASKSFSVSSASGIGGGERSETTFFTLIDKNATVKKGLRYDCRSVPSVATAKPRAVQSAGAVLAGLYDAAGGSGGGTGNETSDARGYSTLLPVITTEAATILPATRGIGGSAGSGPTSAGLSGPVLLLPASAAPGFIAFQQAVNGSFYQSMIAFVLSVLPNTALAAMGAEVGLGSECVDPNLQWSSSSPHQPLASRPAAAKTRFLQSGLREHTTHTTKGSATAASTSASSSSSSSSSSAAAASSVYDEDPYDPYVCALDLQDYYRYAVSEFGAEAFATRFPTVTRYAPQLDACANEYNRQFLFLFEMEHRQSLESRQELASSSAKKEGSAPVTDSDSFLSTGAAWGSLGWPLAQQLLSDFRTAIHQNLVPLSSSSSSSTSSRYRSLLSPQEAQAAGILRYRDYSGHDLSTMPLFMAMGNYSSPLGAANTSATPTPSTINVFLPPFAATVLFELLVPKAAMVATQGQENDQSSADPSSSAPTILVRALYGWPQQDGKSNFSFFSSAIDEKSGDDHDQYHQQFAGWGGSPFAPTPLRCVVAGSNPPQVYTALSGVCPLTDWAAFINMYQGPLYAPPPPPQPASSTPVQQLQQTKASSLPHIYSSEEEKDEENFYWGPENNFGWLDRPPNRTSSVSPPATIVTFALNVTIVVALLSNGSAMVVNTTATPTRTATTPSNIDTVDATSPAEAILLNVDGSSGGYNYDGACTMSAATQAALRCRSTDRIAPSIAAALLSPPPPPSPPSASANANILLQPLTSRGGEAALASLFSAVDPNTGACYLYRMQCPYTACGAQTIPQPPQNHTGSVVSTSSLLLQSKVSALGGTGLAGVGAAAAAGTGTPEEDLPHLLPQMTFYYTIPSTSSVATPPPPWNVVDPATGDCLQQQQQPQPVSGVDDASTVFSPPLPPAVLAAVAQMQAASVTAFVAARQAAVGYAQTAVQQAQQDQQDRDHHRLWRYQVIAIVTCTILVAVVLSLSLIAVLVVIRRRSVGGRPLLGGGRGAHNFSNPTTVAVDCIEEEDDEKDYERSSHLLSAAAATHAVVAGRGSSGSPTTPQTKVN